MYFSAFITGTDSMGVSTSKIPPNTTISLKVRKERRVLEKRRSSRGKPFQVERYITDSPRKHSSA